MTALQWPDQISKTQWNEYWFPNARLSRTRVFITGKRTAFWVQSLEQLIAALPTAKPVGQAVFSLLSHIWDTIC